MSKFYYDDSVLDRVVGVSGARSASRSRLSERIDDVIPSLSDVTLLSDEGAVRLGEFAVSEADSVADAVAATTLAALKHPNERYLAMSVVQKAIRLGDFEMASRATAALINSGQAAAAWRRLRVIAVEDIGLADTEVSCFVEWMAGNAGLRRSVGDRRLALVAISHLCTAAKSRDMCDVASWINLPNVLDSQVGTLKSLPTPELLDVVSDPNAAFRMRVAAARCFYPHKFKDTSPWKKRSLADRMAMYARLGTRPAVAYMIEKDVSFGGDVLTATGPIVDCLIRSTEQLSVASDPLDPGGAFPQIGGVYASAFDRHTHKGKTAIGILLAKEPALQRFFDSHTTAQPMDCLMRSVFYVEGAILRPRLLFDGSLDLYWSILDAKFRSTGLPGLDPVGFELLELTRSFLPRLDGIRAYLDRR